MVTIALAICVCCRKRFYRAGPSPWSICTSIIRSRARMLARSTSASSTTFRTARSFCASYRSVKSFVHGYARTWLFEARQALYFDIVRVARDARVDRKRLEYHYVRI